MNTAIANQQALDEAIEQLYSTFASYRLYEEIDGCPHCVSAEDQACIHSRPLRELSADDLERYSMKALTTWGDVYNFRHFLPRLLELVASEGMMWTDPEIVLSKLDYAKWREWPQTEQQAVENFFAGWWRVALDNSADDTHITAVLCAFATADVDLQPFLDYWDRLCKQSQRASIHLGRFVDRVLESLLRNNTLGPFWEIPDVKWGRDTPAQRHQAQVVEWLAGSTTNALIPQAYSDWGAFLEDDELEAKGSQTAQTIVIHKDAWIAQMSKAAS